MDKKGLVKIIEAFIAVTIVASAVIFIYVVNVPKIDNFAEIEKLEEVILDRIAFNDTLRQAVLDSGVESSVQLSAAEIRNRSIIKKSIEQYIPQDYTFEFTICKLNEICGLKNGASYYTKNEIYANEKSISSTLEENYPKKIRLFMWLK